MRIEGTELACRTRTVYPEKIYDDIQIVEHHSKHGRRMPFQSSARPSTTRVEVSEVKMELPGRGEVSLGVPALQKQVPSGFPLQSFPKTEKDLRFNP
jgi:hypothetical protein